MAKKRTFKRLKSIGDQVIKGAKKLRRKRSYSYYSALGFFFLLYLLIFVSGFSTSQKYQYVEVETGEGMPMGQGTLQVVKREYNPEENFIRVDYWLSTDSSMMDLSNIQFETTAIEKKNLEEHLEMTVVRVDSNYYVTYVKGLKEGFGTVKQTLVPSSIQVLRNSQDEFNHVEMAIYTKEETAKRNLDLAYETEVDQLIGSSIHFQTNLVEELIKELEEEIELNEETIQALEKSIRESKDGLSYLISEDVLKEESSIKSRELEIANYQSENSESKKQIELHKKRIILLKQKGGTT